MENQKLQIVAVNVEGDAETIREVLRQADRILGGRNGADPAVDHPAALPALPPTPVRPRKGGRGKRGGEAKSFPCRKCGKGCATPQGRGKHESACAGGRDPGKVSGAMTERLLTPSPEEKSYIVKPYQCDVCGARSTSKAGVAIHKARAHR